MAARGEVTVQTMKKLVHLTLNGDVRTIADAVKEVGEDPEAATIRLSGVLVTDTSQELEPGATLSVFKTSTVGTAGVKGAIEVTDTPQPSDENEGGEDDEEADNDAEADEEAATDAASAS